MRTALIAIVFGGLLLGCGASPSGNGRGGSGGGDEPGGQGGGGAGAGGSGGATKPSGGKADSGATSSGGSGGGGTSGERLDGAAPAADAGAPPTGGGDDAGAGGSGGATGDGGAVSGPPTLGMHIYDGMTKIFDGMTLSNWEQRPANSWEVKDGAMASKGSGRGYINTKADYGDYRLIFSVRQVSGNHQPCILIYGIRPPPNDALGAIQVQPPNGYTWDYRPGHNTSGSALFTKYPHPKLDAKKWNQCEVLVKVTGTFRFGCCELTGNGPCRATESLKFNDPTAGRKGPIAWQMHNDGIHDEYKDVFVEENPKVDDLITTK